MKSSLGCLGKGMLVVFLFIVFSVFLSTTTTTPHPRPPGVATNVFFHETHAWQSWEYQYRFDAPPEVCEAFAIQLMKEQYFHEGEPVIVKSKFTKFPIGSRTFQPWFDPSSVTDGVMITADDWIYAVVDRARGRLYYYNHH